MDKHSLDRKIQNNILLVFPVFHCFPILVAVGRYQHNSLHAGKQIFHSITLVAVAAQAFRKNPQAIKMGCTVDTVVYPMHLPQPANGLGLPVC